MRRISTFSRLILALLAIALPFTNSALPAAAEFNAVPTPFAINDGVLTIAADDERAYASGYFQLASDSEHPAIIIRGAAAFDTESGIVSDDFPSITGGVVYDIVGDGSGGFYIGGSFTTVGGVSRSGLAHILADGSLDQEWSPDVTGTVREMARSGSVLYVGGAFTAVDGTSRSHLAAIDADGVLTSWAPESDGEILAVEVSGETVYIGGNFTAIDGEERVRLAAIATDGTLTPWNPEVTGVVYALAVAGSTVYVGGSFTQVSVVPTEYFDRQNLAAITTDGVLLPWNPGTDSQVEKLLVDGSTVYIGGFFTSAGGEVRSRLAAVGTDGVLLPWNPRAQSIVFDMAIKDSVLFISGSFSSVGEEPRSRIAAIGTDGTLQSWNPAINGQVFALAVEGNTVYAGGDIYNAGGISREAMVAISHDDFSVVPEYIPFIPNGGQAVVSALSPDSSILYIGGSFDLINGESRERIAAVRTSDGSLIEAFAPTIDNFGEVKSMTISSDGSTLYIGGNFTSVSGESRNNIAALDTSDGSVIGSFDPDADDGVEGGMLLSSDGSILYFGGDFSTVGGESRSGVAAVYTTNGTPVAGFAPVVETADGSGRKVRALALSPDESVLYMGGRFNKVNAVNRAALAAVSTSDGSLITTFNPGANNLVRNMVLSPDGSRLYVTGQFTSVGGQSIAALASINTANGSVNTGFNQDVIDAGVGLAISPSGRYLYAGNGYNSNQYDEDSYFMAVFTDPTVVSATSPTVTTAAASDVTQTSATLIGSITATGNANASVRGFAYGTTLPYSATSTQSGSFSTGSFSASIALLECGTAYRYAAFATNLAGTSYGSDSTFTTAACDRNGGGGGRSRSSSAPVEAPAPSTAPAPVSSVAIPIISRDLEIGSSGAEVLALQQFLIAKGQPIAAGATGYFGAQTKAALAAWQAVNGIVPASGFLGPVTRAFIATHSSVTAPASAPTAPTTPASTGRDLTLGSTGADVTALQNWLISKGHTIAAGATGYFGAQTKAALAAWQAANGVTPAAGYFDPITRSAFESGQ